jgi:hypothetical protein
MEDTRNTVGKFSVRLQISYFFDFFDKISFCDEIKISYFKRDA